MNRRYFLLSSTLLALAPTARTQTKSLKLVVQVRYTGSGTVDESHKIYVALWDTPDFASKGASLVPADTTAITAKSAEAHFDNIQITPAYISLVYDPTGNYDGMSAPPAGASVGFYSTQPGVPAPIPLQPGRTTTVTAKLDDSFKT